MKNLELRHSNSKNYGLNSQYLALFIFALVILFSRLYAFNEPLEVDLLTYTTIGHEVLEGEHLYSDVFDVKPPGLYWTYALAELLTGFGASQVFFLGIFCSLASLLGIYLLGSQSGKTSGMIAAAFWTVVQSNLDVQANQPNTEAFMNMFMIWGVLAVTKHSMGQKSISAYFLAGICFALGSTFKPLVVIPAALIAIINIFIPASDQTRKNAFMGSVIIGLTGAFIWMLIFLYSAYIGEFEIYWLTNIEMNANRGGSSAFNLYRYLREGLILPRNMFFLIPAILMASIAAARGIFPRNRNWCLWIVWVISVHLMIFIPGGPFHPHAYQLWLPVLAVGTGWAWSDFRAATTQRLKYANRIAIILVFGVAIVHELPKFSMPIDEWAEYKYGLRPSQDQHLGLAINELVNSEDDVFLLGNGAAPYYYSIARPPTPTMWSMFLIGKGDLSEYLRNDTLKKLSSAPPKYIVIQDELFKTENKTNSDSGGLAYRLLAPAPAEETSLRMVDLDIYKWIEKNYSAVENRNDIWNQRYTLYELN